MNRCLFVQSSFLALVGGIYLLCAHNSAQAQPNSPGWQAMQSHMAAQQATNHSMQQHWHSQQVMQTSRDSQNNRSSNGAAGQGFQQPDIAAQLVWQPGDRFSSDDLQLEYERLSNVDYGALSPIERGQYKAACRKFRLAVRHGYVYR